MFGSVDADEDREDAEDADDDRRLGGRDELRSHEVEPEHHQQDEGDEEVVPGVARVLADEQSGRVAAERDGDHRGHDHDRRDVAEPRGDADQPSDAEPLDQVGDQPARRRISSRPASRRRSRGASPPRLRSGTRSRPRRPPPRPPRRAARRSRRRSSTRSRARWRRGVSSSADARLPARQPLTPARSAETPSGGGSHGAFLGHRGTDPQSVWSTGGEEVSCSRGRPSRR